MQIGGKLPTHDSNDRALKDGTSSLSETGWTFREWDISLNSSNSL